MVEDGFAKNAQIKILIKTNTALFALIKGQLLVFQPQHQRHLKMHLLWQLQAISRSLIISLVRVQIQSIHHQDCSRRCQYLWEEHRTRIQLLQHKAISLKFLNLLDKVQIHLTLLLTWCNKFLNSKDQVKQSIKKDKEIYIMRQMKTVTCLRITVE